MLSQLFYFIYFRLKNDFIPQGDLRHFFFPEHIVHDWRYTHFFGTSVIGRMYALGAFDGTSVPLNVAYSQQNRQRIWKSKDNVPSTNVLCAINWIMEFVFVFAGWEGSAHDSRILNDARVAGGFTDPDFLNTHYFWLADRAYALSAWCLTPFMNVRYHIAQFDHVAPLNRQELFNFCHASLRNYVERGYGVVKKRYPLLNKMHSVSIDNQMRYIEACFMIHNWVVVTPRNYTELEDIYLIII